MSWIVKAGKQGKKIIKKLITPAEKHYVMSATPGASSACRRPGASAP